MEVLQRLVKNGSSTQMNIPVKLLRELGWQPGNYVTLTLTEDRRLMVERVELKRTRIAPVETPASGDLLAEAV